GSLGVPHGPVGLVVLAGDRDGYVAEALRARGLATLRVELDTRRSLEQLAGDLHAFTDWLLHHSTLAHLQIGYIGARAFAAAAMIAAARAPEAIRAVVALDGRIDVAGAVLG